MIGTPILGMGLSGCAAACEATVSPTMCEGFSLYNVEDVTDVCILLSEINRIEAFECTGGPQKKGAPSGAKCMVKMSSIATGYKPKADFKTYPRCFSTEKNYGVKSRPTIMSLPQADEVGLSSGAPLVKAKA